MKYKLNLTKPDTTVIKSDEDIRNLREEMKRTDLIAIDTETTGLDISRDVVVFWSIATDLKSRYFLEADYLKHFSDILKDPSKAWIGSQIKYDANIIANTGEELGGDLFCTLTMDRLLDADNKHGLKYSYEREFNERMKSFAETFYDKSKGNKFIKPRKEEMYETLLRKYETNFDEVVDYASMDSWAVLRLFHRLKEKLKKSVSWAGYTLWDIFIWVEVPFTKVLYNMERRGVNVNVEYLTSKIPEIESKKTEIEKGVNKAAGRVVNINSPQQLVAWLYDELGYECNEYTDKGQKKLDKTAYKNLIEQGCKEASLIQEYKAIDKIRSTYIKGLLDRCVEGVIHTTYNQHIAATGRLSSSDPNLQNQISDGKGIFDIRLAFVPPLGHVFVVGDYEQLEMYILADYSDDPYLLKSIKEGRDIHCACVELVYEEPYDEILAAKQCDNPDDRQKYLINLRKQIKVIEFGIAYGKAKRSLSIDLEYPKLVAEKHPDWSSKAIADYAADMAQEKIDLFFEKNNGVRKFIDYTIRQAYKKRYVETKLGRRRYLYKLLSWDEMMDHKIQAKRKGRDLCWCRACKGTRDDERAAVNTRIQGTAADICSMAEVVIENDELLTELDYLQRLQVHDEIGGTAPYENRETVVDRVKYCMEHPGLKLNVPLRADPHWGYSWSEAK